MWWSLQTTLSKYFWKVLSMYTCGGVYWNAAPGMDWRGANSYPDSLNTKNPASKGPDCAEHTPIQPLLTRVLRCNITGFVWVWKVQSRYLVLSATWEARPWLAGLAEPRGWSLISKFAQNHQHIIQRKSSWKLDSWVEEAVCDATITNAKFCPHSWTPKCFRFLLHWFFLKAALWLVKL